MNAYCFQLGVHHFYNGYQNFKNNHKVLDVLIIGGGVAGLCNAIELAKAGLDIVVVEKKNYPFHKVCGEYVSMEVLDYIKYLGVDPFEKGAKAMKRFQLSAVNGASVYAKLPLGGFSLSRYQFDLLLYERAKSLGVTFQLQDEIVELENKQKYTQLKTKKGKFYCAKIVLGTQGKRSILDKQLNRPFFKEQTFYSGIKCHYKGDFPDDLVALHNFRGGYCGLSQVETGHINVCYLVETAKIKFHGGVDKMEQTLLSENPHLKAVFHHWQPVFERKLAISQIYFKPKKQSVKGVLMAGDAAGMIYPLSGNGMAMAIHSAKILSALVIAYFEKELTRADLEATYQKSWKKLFATRLYVGMKFQQFFGYPWVSNVAVQSLKFFPFMKQAIIQMTHGKPIYKPSNQ